jgi:hypothetical protein
VRRRPSGDGFGINIVEPLAPDSSVGDNPGQRLLYRVGAYPFSVNGVVDQQNHKYVFAVLLCVFAPS